MKLTVYHDGQYWIGVFEETVGSKLKACRYVFGAEPADQEILDLINLKMLKLLETVSSSIQVKSEIKRPISPKRLARQAAAEVRQRGISTYAQQAIALERESRKQSSKIQTKAEREEIA
ncbi:MAG TPA: YjdF family protein [Bacillota bacterium]|nr:YjdF family protein [Bacillota bacterium]HOL11051.1 YjdF family protein [Bacillota bacterium]HPO98814.1 YjdF family protein [Bacillota bacterium]